MVFIWLINNMIDYRHVLSRNYPNHEDLNHYKSYMKPSNCFNIITIIIILFFYFKSTKQKTFVYLVKFDNLEKTKNQKYNTFEYI